jgi:hypothetical protein
VVVALTLIACGGPTSGDPEVGLRTEVGDVESGERLAGTTVTTSSLAPGAPGAGTSSTVVELVEDRPEPQVSTVTSTTTTEVPCRNAPVGEVEFVVAEHEWSLQSPQGLISDPIIEGSAFDLAVGGLPQLDDDPSPELLVVVRSDAAEGHEQQRARVVVFDPNGCSLVQPVTSFGGTALDLFVGFDATSAGGVRCADGLLIVTDLVEQEDGPEVRWEGEQVGYALYGGLWEQELTTPVSFESGELVDVVGLWC